MKVSDAQLERLIGEAGANVGSGGAPLMLADATEVLSVAKELQERRAKDKTAKGERCLASLVRDLGREMERSGTTEDELDALLEQARTERYTAALDAASDEALETVERIIGASTDIPCGTTCAPDETDGGTLVPEPSSRLEKAIDDLIVLDGQVECLANKVAALSFSVEDILEAHSQPSASRTAEMSGTTCAPDARLQDGKSADTMALIDRWLQDDPEKAREVWRRARKAMRKGGMIPSAKWQRRLKRMWAVTGYNYETGQGYWCEFGEGSEFHHVWGKTSKAAIARAYRMWKAARKEETNEPLVENDEVYHFGPVDHYTVRGTIVDKVEWLGAKISEDEEPSRPTD